MCISTLAACVVAIILGFAGDSSLADRFEQLRRDFKAREQQFYADLNAARDDSQKVNNLNDEFQRDWSKSIKEATALVAAHGDDPAVFDGLLLIVGTLRMALREDLIPIATRYAVVDPRAGEFAFSLRNRSRESEDYAKTILKQIATQHPLRAVRGQATFALGDWYRQTALPHGQKPPPEQQQNEYLAKARRSYKDALEQFPDVSTPDGRFTLRVKVTAELARLENRLKLEIGQPAPEISGVDLDGQPLRLSDYRGKVVVICFWSTTCGPCMAMVPRERKLVERLRGEPFALLGVNCDEPEDKTTVLEKVRKLDMRWPSWWDGACWGPIQTAYDVHGWPMVYVIDPAGIIRAKGHEGVLLDEAVDKLLAETR
jgi:peroxiredoxin